MFSDQARLIILLVNLCTYLWPSLLASTTFAAGFMERTKYTLQPREQEEQIGHLIPHRLLLCADRSIGHAHLGSHHWSRGSWQLVEAVTLVKGIGYESGVAQRGCTLGRQDIDCRHIVSIEYCGIVFQPENLYTGLKCLYIGLH